MYVTSKYIVLCDNISGKLQCKSIAVTNIAKRKADRCFAGPSLTLNSVSGAETMAVVASEALCP